LLTIYINQFWSSMHGKTRKKDLYKEIKDKIRNVTDALNFTKDLSDNSNLYNAILNYGNEYWVTFTHKIRDNIKVINMLNLSQPRPLLIAILRKFSNKEIVKSIKLILDWSIRFIVTGKLGGGAIENGYSQLAKLVSDEKIINAVQLKKELKISPNDKDFFRAFETLTISKAAFARYLLFTIESEINSDLGELVPNNDPQSVNLEHILPQTFSEEWKLLYSEEDHQYLHKRLGNMTLLVAEDNNKINHSGFDAKKKVFEKSKLLITSQLKKCKQWDTKAINDRQTEFALKALKIWDTKI
ncbi:HNH endonuclease family protein, partial [Candidatus Margulisiibacteriota bacterium]